MVCENKLKTANRLCTTKSASPITKLSQWEGTAVLSPLWLLQSIRYKYLTLLLQSMKNFASPALLALALRLRTLSLYGSVCFQKASKNLILLNLQGTTINLTEIALSHAAYFPLCFTSEV